MKRWLNYLIVLLALGLTASLGAGWTSVVSGSSTLSTPSGALALADSVNVGTVTLNFESYSAAKFTVATTLDTVTSVEFQIQYSDDDGSTWTKITDGIDTDLTKLDLGTAGVMTHSADSTQTFYFTRPGLEGPVGIGGITADNAEARALLFATDLRVLWSATNDIEATYDPEVAVTYRLYKGSPFSGR